MAYQRTLRRAFNVLLGSGAFFVLSGCAILNGFLDPTKVGQFPMEAQERGIRQILTPRETPPGLANATEPSPDDLVPRYEDYRLGAGDVVAYMINDFYGQGIPEQAAVEVSATGYIRLPHVGSVRAIDLTEQELEEELKIRLRQAELLSDPQVRVFVQSARNRVFTILGAVGQSGTYPLSFPDLRLLDAIGIARDIGATVKRLYIIRRASMASPPVEPSADVFEEPPASPEGLVIPPPMEDDEEFRPSLYAAAGYAQRQPPRSRQGRTTQQDEFDALLSDEPVQSTRPTMEDLDRILADEPEPMGQDEAEPFVFDPHTGELVPTEPQRETQPELESDALDELVLEPEEEPFDWDAVPEFELSQRVIEIDVRALRSGDPRQNVVVRNRDVIHVPVDTGIYYMMGEVNRPGVYAFGGRDITLKQALASAGGLGPLAWPQRCEIIRREPGTDKQLTIPVNLDAIFAGLEDDLYLRDDDIVNIGTHVVAPFLFVIRNSFRFTYGFGFVYDRNFADKDAYGAKINPQILEAQRQAQRGLPF